MRRAAIERGVHVGEQYLFRKLRSKDNKIINELTMKLDLTKGLDKVEATTGRINTIIKTLEIIKHNITEGVKDRIGLAHKNTIIHNNKSLYHFRTP